MSYIRAGYPMKYVEGVSSDYVFPGDGYIEDYDEITDEGLVELLFLHWKTEDELFKQHVLQRLAERLKVKLRKVPLDEMEQFGYLIRPRITAAQRRKRHKEVKKRFGELRKLKGKIKPGDFMRIFCSDKQRRKPSSQKTL